MSGENEVLLDLDSMLEETMDAVEAAPDFVEPPDGKYRLKTVSCKLSIKEVTDEETGKEVQKARILCILALVACHEQVNQEELPAELGSIFSQSWTWTKDGQGFFKAFCNKVLGEAAIKGASYRQLFDVLSDANTPTEFDAKIKTTTSRYKGKEFRNTRLAIVKDGAESEILGAETGKG